MKVIIAIELRNIDCLISISVRVRAYYTVR